MKNDTYYSFGPFWYYRTHPDVYDRYRQYPLVNPSIFHQSASLTQKLLEEANILLQQLQRHDFAYQVMMYAQKSQQKEVEKLLQSTGVKARIETNFNPNGIHIHLIRKDIDCCRIILALRWG